MGGKTTSSNSVPKYIEQGGQEAIARARDVANMGYVPYMGPDVALPGQGTLAAWQNQDAAANAFGMAAPTSTGLEGLPVANNGGVQGFSSFPGYKAALANLEGEYPGLYAYLKSMMIDPMTGADPTRAPQPQSQFGGLFGGALGGFPNLAGFMGDAEGSGLRDSGYGGGGGGGGYSGIGDMFDGGGPGASGGSFSGGGRVSDIANAVTGR